MIIVRSQQQSTRILQNALEIFFTTASSRETFSWISNTFESVWQKWWPLQKFLVLKEIADNVRPGKEKHFSCYLELNKAIIVYLEAVHDCCETPVFMPIMLSFTPYIYTHVYIYNYVKVQSAEAGTTLNLHAPVLASTLQYRLLKNLKFDEECWRIGR